MSIERAQQFGFKIGIMLVTSLMIFATYNDILRLTRQLMHSEMPMTAGP